MKLIYLRLLETYTKMNFYNSQRQLKPLLFNTYGVNNYGSCMYDLAAEYCRRILVALR